ncbi:MAG: hypothetical protein KC910_15990 [Candidatus Eremiobacteraeota bacterium]|nr:hypothetical protein [Candidatus Eremiobacteraeota bacterium]
MQPANRNTAEQLDRSGLHFQRVRRFRLPWQEPVVDQTGSQVAESLHDDKVDQYLQVKTPDASAALPLRTPEDLRELAVLHSDLAPDSVAQPQLASGLKELASHGARFTATREQQVEEVGLYGAYNCLTGDFDLPGLVAEVDGWKYSLNTNADAVELGRFYNSNSAAPGLAHEGYQFFDALGRQISPQQASSQQTMRVGKRRPWLELRQDFEPSLDRFAKLLKPLGNEETARKYYDFAQPDERLTQARLGELVEVGASPAEKVALTRYGLTQSDWDQAEMLLTATAGLKSEAALEVLQDSLAAHQSKEALGRRLLDKAGPSEASSLAAQMLADRPEPACKWALELGKSVKDQPKLTAYLYQQALDHPDQVVQVAASTHAKAVELKLDQQALKVWDAAKEQIPEAMAGFVEGAIRNGAKVSLASWGSVHALCQTALSSPQQDPAAAARQAVQEILANPKQAKDAALVAEGLLRSRPDDEVAVFGLAAAKDDQGNYRFKQWRSIAEFYHQLLNGSSPDEIGRKTIDALAGDETCSQDMALLGSEMLKAEGRLDSIDSWLKPKGRLAVNSWTSVAAIYRAALDNEQPDQLALAAFKAMTAHKYRHQEQDAAWLAEINLLRASIDPTTRDVAETALTVAKVGTRYQLAQYGSILALYGGALEQVAHGQGGDLAALARLAVERAATPQDACVAGAGFLTPLRWSPETKESAYIAMGLVETQRNYNSRAAVLKAFLANPRLKDPWDLASQARQAAADVTDSRDRLALLKTTLEQLGPRFGPDEAKVVEDTLAKLGGLNAKKAADTLEATLDMLAVTRTSASDTQLQVHEERVDIGDISVDIQQL